MTQTTTATPTPTKPARARIIALRVAVTAMLAIVAVNIPVDMLITLVGWLPDSTLDKIGADDLVGEMVHGAAIGVFMYIVVLGLAMQLRPSWPAPLWLTAFVIGADAVFDAYNGTVGDPIWWVVYALVAAVIVLVPKRTGPLTPVRWPALGLALVAAGPVLWYSWTQFRLHVSSGGTVAGIDHGNHFFNQSAVAVALLLAAVLGATALKGSRATAWLAGSGVALVGLVALAHRGDPSSVPAGWAVAAMVWGLAYLWIAAVRPRAARDTVS
jgi:hypothetical protein